ncbi:rhomboid family intramembrane serine protease [Psychroflexus sp. ALD_RP9]|uniref:rhomboid family intramembrane serine protease n=1 Tax=Psychroflexus sp. ALD_RP9 TaxID=2777186 RepID=UPI001A8C5AD6|nr:rhomboid family intramembrane serine protease [Psychroflexus sp. ALD_RP9]QSS97760.1 rhomboid family intramembrane serine protease [Psychroflexus sp. ALD_RP9]
MNFYSRYRFIFLPVLLLLAIWFVYWIEIRYHLNFNNFGILPRNFDGLIGILTSGFIHSGINHLYSNSFPIVILSAALAFFYKQKHLAVLLLGYLCCGILTWLIGRESYHIGASGLIYFLASFLFFNGIKSKSYRLIALALTVVFVYGSLVWGTFPKYKTGISWEGHLSGFIIGFIISYFIKPEVVKVELQKPKQVEETAFEIEFMQQFDEHGNFNPIDSTENNHTSTTLFDASTDIEWHFDDSTTNSPSNNLN